MAIPLAPILGGAAGLLSGLFGGGGSKQTSTTTRTVGPATTRELEANQLVGQQLTGLQDVFGQQDVGGLFQQGQQAQNQFALALQQAAETGGFATGGDVGRSQEFVNMLFAPRQTELQRRFQEIDVQQAREAGLRGRSASDPILRAKALQTQEQLQAGLESEKTSAAAQFAQGAADRRLQFGQQFADIRGGLAQQAISNRLLLLSLGSQIGQQERGFRLGAAGTSSTGQMQFPGGFAQAAGGLLGGIGVGVDFARLQNNKDETTGSNVLTGGPANTDLLRRTRGIS